MCNICIRFSTHLGLQLERPWRVELFHRNFNELNPLRTSKRPVLKEIIKLVLRVHGIRLRCLAIDSSKGLEELRPIPAPVGLFTYLEK